VDLFIHHASLLNIFMVLTDVSNKWSHIYLLSSQNIAFARLIAQIIRLRAQFSDYLIKKIWLDNTGEFTFQAFDKFCTSIWIEVEHLVAHVHTQNDLAKLFIKLLQLIVRPLLMKSKLSISVWGHVILHVASLVWIRLNVYHKYFSLQLVFGIPPNIFYLWTFSCAIYMSIAPP
jgi:hypothetical protein